MPQQILVMSPCNEANLALCNLLSAMNFPSTSATTLTRPSSMERRPALCLVSLKLCRSDTVEWEAWVQDCQSIGTACLFFGSSAQPANNITASLAPLSACIFDPLDRELLADKINSLLTIRKLARQLDATRHQLAHYQEELQDALQSAANVQRRLIPKRQHNYHNLRFAWQYMPCKQVGGDLFNIVQLDEQTVMVYLMDVSGHGISSAMVTVSVHQSLSLHTGQLVKRPLDHPPYYQLTSPKKVLQELDAEYPFERFEEFFTISYLLINPHTGYVRYCNAGHPPPLLLHQDGGIEKLACGGTIIGVGELADIEDGEIGLKPGDRIFMYTDGITEHIANSGEPYGENRFTDRLKQLRNKPIDHTIRDTLIDMREFGGSTLPVDDVTLIGIEFCEEKPSQK